MPIALQFCNLIIKVSRLEDFRDFLSANDFRIGKNMWFDGYLLREGAMSSWDVDSMVEEWGKAGLDVSEASEDMCVADAIQGVPVGCSWLSFNSRPGTVKYKGDEHETIVLDNHYQEHLEPGSEGGSFIEGAPFTDFFMGFVAMNDPHYAVNCHVDGGFRFYLPMVSVLELNSRQDTQAIILYDYMKKEWKTLPLKLVPGVRNRIVYNEGLAEVVYEDIDWGEAVIRIPT